MTQKAAGEIFNNVCVREISAFWVYPYLTYFLASYLFNRNFRAKSMLCGQGSIQDFLLGGGGGGGGGGNIFIECAEADDLLH